MEPIEEAPFPHLEQSTAGSARLGKMMMSEVGTDDDSDILDQSTNMIDISDEPIEKSSNHSFSRENLENPLGVPTVKRHHHGLDKATPIRSKRDPPTTLLPHTSSPSRNQDNTMTSNTTLTTVSEPDLNVGPAVVSPITEGHPSPTSHPSIHPSMMESPTSVITEVGIGSVSGMSSIVGSHSPSSTHIDMMEKHRRHRIRHHLDGTDENGISPEVLFGHWQREPLSMGSHHGAIQKNDDNDGLISKRLQEIESKKVSLHQKRICLEQKLYDFVDSEKRTKLMLGNAHSTSMSLNLTYSTCSLDSPPPKGGLASPRSLLQPPTPSPDKVNQRFSVFKNGDEMVQDYPWSDPRTKEIGYRYSGPLNTLKLPHGWGIMRFLDGQIYEGQIYNGYRWGMGTNKWPDGQVYCGEWEDHSRNGRGTHTWKDGRRVNGQWRGGHLNGRVIFSWPNGACFDGEVRMGKKHGRGTHTFANGKLYVGNFVDGKEEGFGSLTHGDWKYRGQFKAGKREGYGMQIWKNKTYDGEWSNNKAHGKGRIVWQNGSTYTGEFRMGKYHGLGVYLFPSGKKYVGSWDDGFKHGQGIYTWPSGKKYDGAYSKGLKEGYGRLTWPDGSMYCGSFKKGLREGRGIQTNANGSMYHCGLWKKDKPYIKGEQLSASNSIESDSLVSDISLSDSAKLRFQRGGQNTSEEDIVIMESQSVVAADESMNSRPSHVKAAIGTSKEPQDLPTHSNSLVLSPEVRTIPATPSKMDEVSSFGSCDQDVEPNFLVREMERISL